MNKNEYLEKVRKDFEKVNIKKRIRNIEKERRVDKIIVEKELIEENKGMKNEGIYIE